MNIIDRYKRLKYKRLLGSDDLSSNDIVQNYIEMPNSIYSYLNMKNKHQFFYFELEKHLAIDKLISVEEMNCATSFLNKLETATALAYTSYYINDLSHRDILKITINTLKSFIHYFHDPYNLKYLINQQDTLFHVIKHLGPTIDIHFINGSHYTEEAALFNIMDIFGMLIKKHKEFMEWTYDKYDGMLYQEFKSSLPSCLLSDDKIQYLLDHGFRFSHLELYDNFESCVSAELKNQIDTLRLLQMNHEEVIQYLHEPIANIKIQDMQII